MLNTISTVFTSIIQTAAISEEPVDILLKIRGHLPTACHENRPASTKNTAYISAYGFFPTHHSLNANVQQQL
jgi:hypothetical protein